MASITLRYRSVIQSGSEDEDSSVDFFFPSYIIKKAIGNTFDKSKGMFLKYAHAYHLDARLATLLCFACGKQATKLTSKLVDYMHIQPAEGGAFVFDLVFAICETGGSCDLKSRAAGEQKLREMRDEWTTDPDEKMEMKTLVRTERMCALTACSKFLVEPMMCCSRCKVARYCSLACQHAHWRSHKAECREIAAAKAAGATTSGSSSSS